ncbi:HNH endonuclease [Janthinobacterium rivuli]|uniref:HNH endonuclease n=1 Tax=Janthinobacterium rivuli TaxID=2751478 RepID=UPI00383A9C23
MFNVQRTNPAPASLADKKSYSGSDVMDALAAMFHNKCYLCETSNPTSLNVEHFDPQVAGEDRTYDWDNLFYSCARCNNVKLAGYRNLLNCTDKNVDVFSAIKLLPPLTPYGKNVIVQPMFDDPKTVETAKLLSEIYNTDRTANKRITGSYLREGIYKKYNRLLKFVNQYFSNESSDEQKNQALGTLKVLMGNEQEYSAFLRWIVLDDVRLSELLSEYIVN